jgi:hypothetical protein
VTLGAATLATATSAAHIASDFTHNAYYVTVPFFAIFDGSARFVFGLSMLIYPFIDFDRVKKDLEQTGTSFNLMKHPYSMVPRALFEMLKGVPSFYYGMQALPAAPMLAFYGLACTFNGSACGRHLLGHCFCEQDLISY